MDDLISVIIPVYNVEKFLDKCIQSVVKQSYINLEIILVNDGSLDGSGGICDKWSKLDSRIKVIHQQNGGLSKARNTGLDIATGEYIGFVDSDDYICVNMYEHLIELAKKNNSEMVICNYRFVDTKGAILRQEKIIKNEILSKYDMFKKITESSNFYFVTAVNKIYSRSIFDDLRFPIGKIHEDEFIIHKVINKCNSIATVDNYFYNYVQRDDSIMHSKYSIKRLDGMEALIDRYLFYKKERLNEYLYMTMIQCYAILMNCILNVSVIENKTIIKKKMFLMIKKIGLNLRNIKLLLVYNKKNLSEHLSYLKFLIFFGIDRLRYKNCSKIYLMGTPSHGNLGDQAIVNAEYQFLSKYFPTKTIIEIRNVDYLRYSKYIEKYINNEDIIVIDGGGNMGVIWPDEDDKIRDIISRFSDNNIIIFPQTCFYNETFDAQRRIELNRKAYEKCKGLVIMLRDKASFNNVNRMFPTVKSFFVPDIVLYTSVPKLINEPKKKTVLLCFREDREKMLKNNEISLLKTHILNSNTLIMETDTVIGDPVTKKNRNKQLYSKWGEFQTTKLVITDRLHGMIFAAINSTPCIAFDNSSKKVSGVYTAWLKHLPYIKCVANIGEAIEIFETFQTRPQGYFYDYTLIEKKYKEVVEEILEW